MHIVDCLSLPRPTGYCDAEYFVAVAIITRPLAVLGGHRVMPFKKCTPGFRCAHYYRPTFPDPVAGPLSDRFPVHPNTATERPGIIPKAPPEAGIAGSLTCLEERADVVHTQNCRQSISTPAKRVQDITQPLHVLPHSSVTVADGMVRCHLRVTAICPIMSAPV